MKDARGIFRNTAILYVRMLVLMLISLYTTRIVLEALGVVDYGLFNVVGGVVVTIGFLTATMNTSSARFITVALGRGDIQEMRSTFSNILLVNALLAVLVVAVCETAGLWFVLEKMTIPADRMSAALWVYQISILSAVTNILSISYNACIIAHERMKAFAYITIIDGVGKLVVAYALLHVGSMDRLVLYAVLILLVHVCDQVIYVVYCRRHFAETRIVWRVDRALLRRIGGFISWASYGSLVTIGFTQGLNILLNMFCGPAVNAARAIAVQIQNIAVFFTNNFQVAVNPRIIKGMARQDTAEVQGLLRFSSKLSFFLLCMVGVPLLFVVPELLQLWLKNVPEHTVAFVRLMIVISIFSSVANPLRVINQAEGNIRKFQLCECTVLLMIVPVSYIFLKQRNIPEIVFVVHLVIELAAHWIRVWIVLPKIAMRWSRYLREIYLPPVIVLAITLALCFPLNGVLGLGIGGRIAMVAAAEIILLTLTYFIGMDKTERSAALALVAKKLRTKN